MNRKQFEKSLEEAKFQKANMNVIHDWYEQTLSLLQVFHEQSKGVKHSKYRGDTREAYFRNFVQGITPSAVKVGNGFALSSHTSSSREIDILFLDRSKDISLMSTSSGNFYPIEAVLGALEIKSNLDLIELRRSIVSCVNLKVFDDFLYEKEIKAKSALPVRVGYSVFSFASPFDLDGLSRRITEHLRGVETKYWPESIFVLGKGALLLGPDGGLPLKGVQEDLVKYHAIPSFGTALFPNSVVNSFLWFILGAIDRCLERLHSKSRRDLKFIEYLFRPMLIQLQVERHMAQTDPEGFKLLVERSTKNKISDV